MDKLATFLGNNPANLFRLARELNQSKFFDNFFTETQLKLLQYILAQNNEEVWANFISGNCVLELEGTDDGAHTLVEPGTTMITAMAMHVRYLLWEKAVDYYYMTQELDDVAEVSDEYALINELDDAEPGAAPEDGASTEAAPPAPKPARDEEDDYDDDDDDEMEEAQPEKPVEEKAQAQFNDAGQVVIAVPLALLAPSEQVHELHPEVADLEAPEGTPQPGADTDTPQPGTSAQVPSETNTPLEEQEKLREFNKVYHLFEHDKDTLIKRRKLERQDQKLEEAKEKDEPTKEGTVINLGAATLLLQHLLGTIQSHRDDVPLLDYELRTLFMDVRKNRGKWANDERVGQEELYEACEKVILELRGLTEHLTPFLNKVSKREAPNYALIIKKPMDLNTVMKKLKLLQYNSKSEFVDDLMLIWTNCLTYNADPRHYLRAHALAMQKKTQKLVPKIPDITIRNRLDIEKEEEAENERQGTPGAEGGKSQTKGRKRTHADEVKIEPGTDDGDMDTPGATPSGTGANTLATTPVPEDLGENGGDTSRENSESSHRHTEGKSTKSEPAHPGRVPAAGMGPGTAPAPLATTTLALTPAATAPGLVVPGSTPVPSGNHNASSTPGPGGITPAPELDDEDDHEAPPELQDQATNEDYFDPQSQAWRTLTAKLRAHYCAQRAALFDVHGHLEPDADAIVRQLSDTNNFNHYLDNKTVVSRVDNLLENDEPYLLEYDITGGLPGLAHAGVTLEDEDRLENRLADQIVALGRTDDHLGFVLPTDLGLNKIYFDNIGQIQEIRKICFKISLIRQMQTQQFVHHTQMKQPEIEALKEVDIDPGSKLPTRDPHHPQVQFAVLRRNVAKVAMQTGFELTQPFAINTLTQVAERYMSNLIRSMKLHSELVSTNQLSPREILLLLLLENGVNKPDDLYTYVQERIVKQRQKLMSLREKLTNFLKELLRPGLENFNERLFEDNSEQFMTGDFSLDLGDDFFGFKELGLDKEFKMLSLLIPIYLLSSRLHTQYNQTGSGAKRNKYEDLTAHDPGPMVAADIAGMVGILQPFYQKLYDKLKVHWVKQQKKKGELLELPEPLAFVMIEDDELPQKQRNVRPRLPPTGKIGGVKKKAVATAFFLPDEEPKEETAA